MTKRHSSRKVSFFDEFFKIYLPDQSSQCLRVPPAFVKKINGTIPNNAKLKDHGGNVWHVEVEEDENGVYFKNGWQRFASDHSLEFGNFLVFKYTGNSLFDVKIFGKNGCMKEEALANKHMNEETVEKTAISVKIEQESEEEQIRSKNIQNCKLKYSEIGMKRSVKSEVTGSEEVSRHKSQSTPSKIIEQHTAFDASEFVVPTNPHFIASLYPSARYRLTLPRQWLVKNGIKMEPEMVLRDQNGKLWPVKVTSRLDGRLTFTNGWADFWKEYSLGLNDQCLFEFAFRRGRRLSREIQVQILR
ncbi:putative B3 domain-containing protein At5g66980 isoform X4 [Camellia sinensis]|uniref:putative B3 domain-containing protein At5g66980 isoform X4 n=1 Tax=Camellia sinensis TaxID=4442 RepID=UPI001035F139|nr:putative B3 domain-containing protein At5g66980 isoform X4 [Camellia sinensis]